DGEGLRDDVDAVGLVFDHLLDAAQLPLDDAGAVQGAILDVGDHADRIYPPGVSTQPQSAKTSCRMRTWSASVWAPPPSCPLTGKTSIDFSPAYASRAPNTVEGLHVSSMSATVNHAGAVARRAKLTPSK